MKVAVDCRFLADGTVQIRQVQIDGRWQPVGQGRQWLDADGRHVLIMLPNDQIQQLTLHYDTLAWEMTPLTSTGSTIV